MTLRTSIFLSLVLAALAFAPAPARAAQSRAQDRDVLFFKNGDTLQGSLLEIDHDQGIQWSRRDAIQPFTFNPEFLSEMRLASVPPTNQWTNNVTIQLANGDQLQGQLLGFDGTELHLATWYAGEIRLAASSVAVLLPLSGPRNVAYQGPTGIEDWTIGKVNSAQLLDTGQWHYSKGAFFASKSASIARDVELPEVASLQFDLEWRGFFNIAVALYTEYLHPVSLAAKENEPSFGGFYSMQINPFSANLLPVKQTEPLRYLGQAPLQNLAQKNRAHFDIRVNAHKKTIALLVDGQLVKQWADNDPTFAGTGTAIRFVHQGQGVVKLSNIKVSEWDGQFEEPPSLTPNKTQDIARLRNGDRIAGPVKAIQDGLLSIEAAATTLEIPMNRVKQVELAAAKPAQPQPGPQTVRAHFASAGSVTFQIQKWTPEGLVAQSDNFGTVTFHPDAFNRIQFDLTPAQEEKETPNPALRFQ